MDWFNSDNNFYRWFEHITHGLPNSPPNSRTICIQVNIQADALSYKNQMLHWKSIINHHANRDPLLRGHIATCSNLIFYHLITFFGRTSWWTLLLRPHLFILTASAITKNCRTVICYFRFISHSLWGRYTQMHKLSRQKAYVGNRATQAWFKCGCKS